MREAMRADKSQSDAAHMLARIYYERKDYDEAVKLSSAAIRRGKDDPEPADYVVAARSLTQLGEYEKARNAADKLGEIPGQEAASVAEHAFVARAESGPGEAVELIDESGLDVTQPENVKVLRALVDNLLVLDRGADALARIDEALAADPESADLYALRGTVLARMGRVDEAEAAFDAALAVDPEDAASLAGLATIAGGRREFAKAVDLFDRADAHAEDASGNYAYAAAQLSAHLGDSANTEERLREIVKMHPGHAGARNDLAWILAEKGEDLDLARALAEEANRLDPSPDILDTLGWVYIKRGEGTLAVTALREANRQKPESASIRYHLGTALALAGEDESAREMLESALDAGEFEDADAARRALAKLGS